MVRHYTQRWWVLKVPAQINGNKTLNPCLQVWLSPYQVAHGVALAENIAATLPRLRAAPLPPPAAAAAAEVRSGF